MAKEEVSTDKTLAAILEKFAEIQQQVIAQARSTSLSEDALESILTRVGANSATAMKQALKPENESPPLISVYEPDGERDHPKAKLKRLTWFCNSPEHVSDNNLSADQLTPFEVDTYNKLGDACAVAGGQLLARNGQYVAELRGYNQKELHVYVKGIDKMDTKTNLPPTLVMLCHEILTGENMQDLNALLAEVGRLRAQVEALGGTPTQRPLGASPVAPTITAAAGPLVADLQKALDQTPHSQLGG